MMYVNDSPVATQGDFCQDKVVKFYMNIAIAQNVTNI